jgi:heme/copper-type cytochrome/quinol oxidase subunit 2
MTIKKPIYTILGIAIFLVLVIIASAFADYIEKAYVAQSEHWAATIVLSILSGIFCSIFPLLLFFIAEVKTRMVENSILIGFIGGSITTLVFGFTPIITELFVGIFTISTLLSMFSLQKHTKD